MHGLEKISLVMMMFIASVSAALSQTNGAVRGVDPDPVPWQIQEDPDLTLRVGDQGRGFSVTAEGAAQFEGQQLFGDYRASEPDFQRLAIFFDETQNRAVVLFMRDGSERIALVDIENSEILNDEPMPFWRYGPTDTVIWDPNDEFAALHLPLAEYSRGIGVFELESGRYAIIPDRPFDPNASDFWMAETLTTRADGQVVVNFGRHDFDEYGSPRASNGTPLETKIVDLSEAFSQQGDSSSVAVQAQSRLGPASPEQSHAAAPTSTALFGPHAVIEFDSVRHCIRSFEQDEFLSCLSDAGASEAGIKAARALSGEGQTAFLLEYWSLGRVDAVQTVTHSASSWAEYGLVLDGQEYMVADFDRMAVNDGASRDLKRRYPNAVSYSPTSISGHRYLENGGQRFILTAAITDGCRACDVIATAIGYMDFRDGRKVESGTIGWAEQRGDSWASPDEIRHRLDRSIHEVQKQLNLRGYIAGSMDGLPGPNFARALQEFRKEYCLGDDVNLTQETKDLLVPDDRFDIRLSAAPCGPGRPQEDVVHVAQETDGTSDEDQPTSRATPAESKRPREEVPPEGWQSNNDVVRALREIVQTYPAREGPGCAEAHGPISEEFRRRLFNDVSMTVVDQRGRTTTRPVTSQLIEGERFCLSPNNAQCAVANYQLHYCASGEMLFLNSGGRLMPAFRVTEVAERSRNPLVSTVVTEELPGRSLSGFLPDGTDCRLSNGGSEATWFRWDGDCEGGLASGSGTIHWMGEQGVISRTRVGSDWGIALSDGVLRYDIDLNAFDFTLANCGTLRRVEIKAPADTPHAYFESSWVVQELMRHGALYAQAECPDDRRRFSNIAVTIKLNDEQVARGRNYDQDDLTWREFRNPAARAMRNEMREARRARAARERERAAQARADALTVEFEGRRDALVAKGEDFITTGRGNIDALATALDVDHIATLDRLERGATLSLKPVDGLATVTHNGERHYRVNHETSSPFRRLEREFRSKQDFSWENFMAELQSAGLFGPTRIACLFDTIGGVPREERDVSVELLSFSRGSDLTVISFLCE